METIADGGAGSPKIYTDLYEWAQAVVFSLTVVVLIFTFLFRIVGVEGPSMENTFMDGERLIISNLNYQPKQGDVVVLYTDAVKKPIIKRVIAVANQTVNVDYKNHCVLVNGKAINEPFIKEIMQEPVSEREYLLKMPLTVPSGHIFVMGDNRNVSFDSRYSQIGFIDEREVIGKVIFRIYPLTRFGQIMSAVLN